MRLCGIRPQTIHLVLGRTVSSKGAVPQLPDVSTVGKWVTLHGISLSSLLHLHVKP